MSSPTRSASHFQLILWPILFAFFAKTAKSVDEEADKIWKYQMYSLVTEFRFVRIVLLKKWIKSIVLWSIDNVFLL